MAITEAAVQAALKDLIDPNTGKTYAASKAIKKIEISGDDVSVHIVLGYPAKSVFEETRAAFAKQLGTLPGLRQANVHVESKIISHAAQTNVKLIPGVRNIIAVASGKGGVGKSTTAVNLALALAAEGANVGMLDADIYGPSQPTMLGLSGKPETTDGKTMEPKINHGIQAMSIGFLIDAETPMVWRGPMVTGALEQLLRDTNWKDLDYLVVDLPPGTGDIQLTLSQKVPVSGAVIVTTPQDIALLDAIKGIEMFRKVEIPVLGIIENMSVHICSQCGHVEHLFGAGGGERIARDFDTRLLGALPLTMQIREHSDSGRPTVVADPDGPIAQIYRNIARLLAARLSEQAQAQARGGPIILVQDD